MKVAFAHMLRNDIL